MPSELPSRLLSLAGADNARDLGGLPAADGVILRRGRLFRGALIPELVPEDVDLLVRRVGLRTVVDLRSSGEADAIPGRWADHGIDWVRCPLFIGPRGPIGDPGVDWLSSYLEYLTGDPEPALRAIRTLIDPSALPALFHCAAGKDRTGVVAALLLDLLGVAHATIAEDCALTIDALPAVIERLATLAPYQALEGANLEPHIPEAETMLGFLRRLNDELGGAAGWLESHGVGAETIAAFRRHMLSD